MPRGPRLTLAAVAVLVAVAAAPLSAATSPRNPSLLPVATSCTVDPAKELFITHLSVVNDCVRTTWNSPCVQPYPPPQPSTQGAWTFGKLIEGIAGTSDPVLLDRFVREWLDHWLRDVTVNSDLVPKRLALAKLILAPWEQASGGPGSVLDMQQAPFRLLAIVSRLDLRNAPAGYGQPGNAGEARFVFGVLDRSQPEAAPEFTVILEYGLDATSCEDVLSWAEAFHGLGSLPFGPDYNAALQSITDSFSAIGASPGKPNGSAINQVRTNEIVLAFPWELREFRLDPTVDVFPAPLVQTTVAQTPDADHDKTQIIADYVNMNEAAILNGTHVVPLIFNGQPFLGGAAPHSLEKGWDGPGRPCSSINDPKARFVFSLNTCSGCHGDDTGTQFYHVFPRAPGSEAQLSAFLTGNGLPVTDRCGEINTFDDIERRRRDLCALLQKTCEEIESEEKLNFVH